MKISKEQIDKLSLDIQEAARRDLDIKGVLENSAQLSFGNGNYFPTYSEAEQMTKKLRAVLNGADVIEMPSEEEMEDKAQYLGSNCTEPYFSAVAMIEFFKSKIVK